MSAHRTPDAVASFVRGAPARGIRVFIAAAGGAAHLAGAVAAHQDWGTSSLLTFSNRLDKTWPGRADFYVDHQIEVAVRRFDTWFEETRPDIDRIDFFHCDTQGTDLKVLKGMGDYFQMIRQGVVEVPLNEEVMLYQGQHTREEVLDFLSDQNYEVYKTTHQQNEDNLYFQRKEK
jgi:FkbM family methyltransferase